MGQDRPDYYSRVEPSPYVPHSGFSSHNVGGEGTIGASSAVAVTYAFPNNGYHYLLDTIYFLPYSTSAALAYVDICDDYSAPDWRCIALYRGTTTFVAKPYESASLSLAYPQGVRAVLYNYDTSPRSYQILMTMYRYVA